MYSVNSKGRDRERLTKTNREDAGEPSVSRSGRRVVFTRYLFTRSDYKSAIWTMRANGSDQRRLTGKSGVADNPAFSPDARAIVFESHFDLFVIDADGRHKKRLTNGRVSDTDPVFSPNGKRIAFERDNEIWVMRANGGRPKRLVRDGGYPEYSPDGRLITYTSLSNGRPEDVWVMNADGSHERRLTAGQDASFSPDGHRLAYTGPDAGILTMRANGSHKRKIQKTGCCPSWGG